MKSPLPKQPTQGFTLIELLIIIAIIGILAAVIFVALNPLQLLRDSRDVVRWNDAGQLMEAIQLNQVKNGGEYIQAIQDMDADEWYMIVDGNGGAAMADGCTDNNAQCDVNISADDNCVDLDELVTAGQIGDIPVSPSALVEWDEGDALNKNGTGYALWKSADTETLIVQACESEGVDIDAISIIR